MASVQRALFRNFRRPIIVLSGFSFGLDQGEAKSVESYVSNVLPEILELATGDPEALRIAAETFELLETHLVDPRAGGYLEGADEAWRPVSEPRRQNPHMHLLEAFLALHEVSGESVYGDAAQRILQLFRERFLDPERGCLGEHFDVDWGPLEGARGRSVEPGHHFEWVWLLHRCASQLGDEAALADAETLFRFGVDHGVDPRDGGVFDEIDRSGAVVKDTKRLWAQTERVKALIARYERDRSPDTLAQLEAALKACFSRYVDPVHHGWKDHLTCEGELLTPLMPATSIYHITLALTEVVRVLADDEG